MPFPWMLSPHTPNPAGFRDGYARELRARAGLLRRLGYTQDAVVARCRQNLSWEFELHGPTPLDEAAIRALVRAVFER